MHVAAILVAAGRGDRVGADRPKQFLDLGGGRTMVDLSLGALLAVARIEEVAVAVPPGFVSGLGPRPRVGPTSPRVGLVEGGPRRQDSVARALARLSAGAELIVIHDAARPFVPPALIERTIDAAARHGAAIAAVPITDTVKEARPAAPDGSAVIAATLPRDRLYLAQTPQTFRREVLAAAMAAADGLTVTDEAMLVERTGFPVHLVAGDPGNVKVTTSGDWEQARARVGGRPAAPATIARIGTGYDLHRLVTGRPLILGGVTIPFARGLHGHSDADIVCHAVTDAVLGAAGAGDIGRLFPDSDAEWRDADSLQLLRRAMAVVAAAGYAVVNVDVTVIAERPKLVPYADRMRAHLAAALGIDAAAVSVKGKTNEGVGEIGRGEAMACHAVALLIHE